MVTDKRCKMEVQKMIARLKHHFRNYPERQKYYSEYLTAIEQLLIRSER